MLELKVDFCLKQDGLHIFDTTGLYDSETNEGGWGVPNDTYGEIVESTLVVKNINNSRQVEFNNVFDTTQSPTEIVNLGIYENTLGDGILKIEYYIKTTNEYLAVREKLYIPAINCCVDTLVMQLLTNEDPVFTQRVLQAEAWRHALKTSAYCMHPEKINEYLEKFKNICKDCFETENQKSNKNCKPCATVK